MEIVNILISIASLLAFWSLCDKCTQSTIEAERIKVEHVLEEIEKGNVTILPSDYNH